MKLNIYSKDRDFYTQCFDLAIEQIPIDEIFPSMIRFNTAIFILKRFWKDRFELLQSENKDSSFAASEEGWSRKVENLKTILYENKLKYAKSYVMQSDYVILLTKDYEMVIVDWALIGSQKLVSREDEDVRFYTRNGEVIDHFKIEGSVTIAPEDRMKLRKREYILAAYELQVRELSSLAMLSQGYLKQNDSRLKYIMCAGSFSNETLSLSKEVLQENASSMLQVSDHGIWKKANEMISWFASTDEVRE